MNIVLFCILLCLFIYFGLGSISGELCIEYENCSSCNYSFLENKKDRWIRWNCDLEFKVAAVIQWLNKTKDCYDAHSEFFHTNVSIDFDNHSFNMSCKVPGEFPLHATWEKGFTCVVNSDNLSLKSEPVIKLACMENYESFNKETPRYNVKLISLLVVPLLFVVGVVYVSRNQWTERCNQRQKKPGRVFRKVAKDVPDNQMTYESKEGEVCKRVAVESECTEIPVDDGVDKQLETGYAHVSAEYTEIKSPVNDVVYKHTTAEYAELSVTTDETHNYSLLEFK